MKVFFIGTVAFSEKLLTTLFDIDEVEMVGIATKSKSDFNADHADLSTLAIAHDVPYKYVRDINAPHIVEWIASLAPDVVFCFGWSSIIKTPILELCPMGVVGYHPAALPANRGRHPIIWALALGLNKTASTFFKMDSGADSGDIVSQKAVEIGLEDDAAGLYDKLLEAALKQVRDFVPKMSRGELKLMPQDNSGANYWRKRGVNDGRIDFRMPSAGIYNLVRALTRPYVGAHLDLDGKLVNVWKCSIGPAFEANHEPGKIMAIENTRILVKTGDGSIWLDEHDLEAIPGLNEYFP